MFDKRISHIERIHNFRDFGGLKVENDMMIQKNVLYRSGSLTYATKNDLEIIHSLKIKTICDLRTRKEIKKSPDQIPENMNIQLIHVPINAKGHYEFRPLSILISLLLKNSCTKNFNELMKQFYREYAEFFIPEFSNVIRLTMDQKNLPILIHCTAGKDRTGFACALIQLVLGVPLESIINDYLLTNHFFTEIRNQFLKQHKIVSIFHIPDKKLLPILEARREYLEVALNQAVANYSSLNNLFEKGLQLTKNDIMSIKQNLLITDTSNVYELK